MHGPNSDVFSAEPESSGVAVAVIQWPPGGDASVVRLKLPLPSDAVVIVVEVRYDAPSPKPDGSHAALEKKSRAYVASAIPSNVPSDRHLGAPSPVPVASVSTGAPGVTPSVPTSIPSSAFSKIELPRTSFPSPVDLHAVTRR